jgi:predicted transcriptional regulator
MSNPPAITERYTTADMIAALEKSKGMISLAARKLNCHPNTVRNYIDRHPTVAQAYREQREGSLDVAELKLMEAVQKGQPWAIAFLLKTLGKGRGYVERMQVENIDVTKLTDDELRALAEN